MMWALLAVWLAGLLTFAAGNASACSCEFGEDAGFIHASLERLPANARGALFQLPPTTGATLAPASFTIVSDRQKSPLKVLVTWPELGIKQPGQLSQRRLARVGPAGGFRPGARYTISYKGKTDFWRFPASTSFTIDATALEVGTYRLAEAGTPVRRLLRLSNDGGLCSTQQAAVVAEFDYRLPDHYAHYRSAMIYASETRNADGSASLIAYEPSLCQPWALDAITARQGRDLLHASCEQPGLPVTVRGRAGLLEVEDRLQVTNDLRIDFNRAAAGACTATAMLNDAVARVDTVRVKELVCKAGFEPSREDTAQRPSWPSMDTLMTLFRMRGQLQTRCLDMLSDKWSQELQYAVGPTLGPAVRVADNVRTHLLYLIDKLSDAVSPATPGSSTN